MWQVRSHNEHGYSSRLSHLEAPTQDRGDISCDLTDFSSINGPLRAVKGTEERDESHVDLTRHCVKYSVTMNKVLHRVYLTWKHPRRWDRDDISGYLTDLSSINGPLRAVKGTEERDESHVDLVQQNGKSAVIIDKVPHGIYLT